MLSSLLHRHSSCCIHLKCIIIHCSPISIPLWIQCSLHLTLLFHAGFILFAYCSCFTCKYNHVHYVRTYNSSCKLGQAIVQFRKEVHHASLDVERFLLTRTTACTQQLFRRKGNVPIVCLPTFFTSNGGGDVYVCSLYWAVVSLSVSSQRSEFGCYLGSLLVRP